MNKMYRPPTLRGGQSPFMLGKKADIEQRKPLAQPPKQTLEQRVTKLESEVQKLKEILFRGQDDEPVNREY